MNLRQWRKDKGLSQAEAAKRLRVVQATISRIENGQQWPTHEMIEHLEKRSGGEITAADLYDAVKRARNEPRAKRGRPRLLGAAA